jgi:hypothetical protein
MTVRSYTARWAICFASLCFGGVAAAQDTSAETIRINEVMAANSTVYADDQREYDDWIELYNSGARPIDVGGLYLSDDADRPTLWQIPRTVPELTTLPPGGFLIVWADGDPFAASELHAPFKLSADGEEVSLYAEDGLTLIDRVRFSEQVPDLSWGRYPDASDQWYLMSAPSPGRENGLVFAGMVKDVEFSHARGLYQEPITVTLATETPDARIYYTLDGSEPYEDETRTGRGHLYRDPIRITGTTCLRAKAMKDDWRDSEVRTHTYIFPADVLHQSSVQSDYPATWGSTNADYGMDREVIMHPDTRHAFPAALFTHRIFSVVCDKDDLFDSTTGIYVHAQNAGVQWERPVSLEIIEPTGAGGLQVNAGLRMQGGASRQSSRPKHNMRLLFKGQYGPTHLEYPLFPDHDVQRFDTIVLRGGNGDSWIHPNATQRDRAQYIRDQWARHTQVDMGRLSAGQCYAHLYLNGLYWGLYHIIERPNAAFFAEHLGGDKADYDVVQHKNGTVDGNRDAWNAMMAVAQGGLQTPAAFAAIQQYLHLDNFMDYMLLNFYVGNTDWDHNNWYGGRRREAGAGWRFFMWDSERIFLGLNDNVTGKDNSNQPTAIHQRLRENADYRMAFADNVFARCRAGGVLSPENSIDRWRNFGDDIRLALMAECARWGDAHRADQPYRPEVEWQDEADFMLGQYFPQRTGLLLNQLRSQALYPMLDPPSIQTRQSADSLEITLDAPVGRIWYTLDGSDPRQAGSGTPSSETLALVSAAMRKYVLVPEGPLPDDWYRDLLFDVRAWTVAQGEPGGIGYDTGSGYESYIGTDVGAQMAGGNASCYVRIPFGFTVNSVTLGQLILRVRYDDGFVAYLNGQEVARRNAPEDLTWNAQATAGHADSAAVQFEDIDISHALDRVIMGENLLALHGLNTSGNSSDFLLDVSLQGRVGPTEVGLSETALAYTGPIQLSHSAELKARAFAGGSFSALQQQSFSVGPMAEGVRISEIMYHPDPGWPDTTFVEVANAGTEPVNLNLMHFATGIDFVFPDLELLPGQRCVVVADLDAFRVFYGPSAVIAGVFAGRLDNKGERLVLADATGKTVDALRYEDDWHPHTDGGGYSLCRDDLLDNVLAAADPRQIWRPSRAPGGSPGANDPDVSLPIGTIVINEVMAHPLPGEEDWIEIYNPTLQDIDLSGWFLSDSAEDLGKFRIAEGTICPAGGYLVFHETLDFGPATGDPAAHRPFALSRCGEGVYLTAAEGDILLGYRDQAEFAASAAGMTWGRPEGLDAFVPLAEGTPGHTNRGPAVGSVVISEIHYHPDWVEGSPYPPECFEYLELMNRSSRAVSLAESDGTVWCLNEGVRYRFEAAAETLRLEPGERVLVVRHPEAFRWRYPEVPADRVFGPYEGRLDNAGETLALSRSGDSENPDCFIPMDRLSYGSGAPWPPSAHGQGDALHRQALDQYGNNVSQWEADTPSPGT